MLDDAEEAATLRLGGADFARAGVGVCVSADWVLIVILELKTSLRGLLGDSAICLTTQEGRYGSIEADTRSAGHRLVRHRGILAINAQHAILIV